MTMTIPCGNHSAQALLALQILLALVVRMGGCLEAHLAVLFRHLAVKLGDHKVLFWCL